ncbi:MAG: enoyl-CoA hydratase/isomerase family protein [Nanoarchaeota archaeon]
MKKLKDVRVEMKDGIAYISIIRPRGNKIHSSTLKELNTVLSGLSDANEIEGIIFHSPTDFSSGAELKELSLLNYDKAKDYSRLGQETMLLLNTMEKPIIAAINGFAFGPGFELALACDARIASPRAVLSHSTAALGITPCFGGSVRLSRLIGHSLTEEFIRTGKRISAQEAHQLGIIDYLSDKKNLLFLAERIIRNDEARKSAFREDDFHEEREAFARCFCDPEIKQRIRKKIR